VPDGVDFGQWLKVYPATGYVITAKPGDAAECIRIFEDVGITAAVVGEINNSLKLDIYDENDRATVFDFKTDDITGITAE